MSIILFLLVAGLIAISLYMIGFWVLALKLRNAGVVDVGSNLHAEAKPSNRISGSKNIKCLSEKLCRLGTKR